MSILLAVAEAGSLSAASRKLGLPLATVSRKMSELETHLSTRLFSRSSRGLAMTEPGQAYLAACRRILDEVAEAERAASGEFSAPKGNLTITTPVVFGRRHVLPIVVEFLRAYPEIDIRLVQLDRIVNLMEENIDLAVRIGDLPDSSLRALRVGEIRRVLCASPDYLAREGIPQNLDDLASHDCITFLTSSGFWTFGRGRAERRVAIRSRLVVNTSEAAIDAATAGAGLTRVLSYQIADAVTAGQLVIVLQDFEPAPWPVSLVHHSLGPAPQKLRAFLDFATPQLRAALRARPDPAAPVG